MQIKRVGSQLDYYINSVPCFVIFCFMFSNATHIFISNFTKAIHSTSLEAIKVGDTLWFQLFCAALLGYAIVSLHIFVLCNVWAFLVSAPAKVMAFGCAVVKAPAKVMAPIMAASPTKIDLAPLEIKLSKARFDLYQNRYARSTAEFEKRVYDAADALNAACAWNKACDASVH
jgi:hypothetical protein